MDRSTRNLSIISLLVLAIFLALNHISSRAALADWGLVLLILFLALAVWFYDRVSRRGVDDDEMVDTLIEPVVYDHQGEPISIPDTIQLVPPNPGTVIHAAPHVPVVHAEPPAAAPTITPHEEETVPPAPIVPPAQPHPTGQPPTTADLPASPMKEESARAAMPTSVLETASGLPTEVKEVQPKPSAFEQPSTTATTTTIEEKSAPPTSASAAETHPELADKAPHSANLSSVPVSDKKADEPVPSPIPGSAPEPIAPRSSTEPVPNIPAKEMPKQSAPGTPPQASTPSAPPVADDVKVSASEAATATPAAPDPTLPINAVPAKPDDLKIIEGIGPKMEKALQAAGINTFAMLAGASEAELRAAITAAGMRFAPTVPTWAEQASYAANGDFVGLEAFQKTLIGGRKAK